MNSLKLPLSKSQLSQIARRFGTSRAKKSNATFRQDLPPPGGYSEIQIERIPARKYFSGYTWFLGIGGMTIGSCWYYTKFEKPVRVFEETETRSHLYGFQPMLIAERERAYLRQLRKNREYEEELMKDVPGWEVGTYFGEPIYQTRPGDEWHDVDYSEFIAHSSYHQGMLRYNIHKFF